MNIYEHKVQYYETDQMAIVHHSNYIRWFEEARTDALEQIGFGYDKMEEIEVYSPVLSVNAEYKSMTRYADIVCIKTWVSKYNGVKMNVNYEISDKATGEVRCIGESSHCFLNKAGHPVSLKRDYPEIDKAIRELQLD
ncbi:MAG: acyl-CoA thioesterase [Eubacteriales bacterium]|nr:acyl-CoA thioesterase [Eubacteriales bacterium]